MIREDIAQLQQFLISQNLLAPDSTTGFFGALTEAAVKQFQCKTMNICSGSPKSNGYGAVGPMTRAAIDAACQTVSITPTPVPNPTPTPVPSPTPIPPSPQPQPENLGTRFPSDSHAFVRGLYTCILERTPTTSEVESTLSSFTSSKRSLESMYRSFLLSEEFAAKRVSDQSYIAKLYRCVLYREADAGSAGWVQQLTGYKSRFEILENFIDSEEFKTGIAPTLLTATGRSAREANDTSPVGPHVGAGSGASFSASDKVLMTPFFFWYNSLTRAAIVSASGVDRLTSHPISMTNPPLSWASKAWWRKELIDVSAAGIDVILPVYWGFPDPTGRSNGWNYGGITTLVETLRDMDAAGQPHAKIGMFYDTSSLEVNSLHRKLDLRTDADRDYFYRTIRDYYSMIPAKYRAQINGKPIIVFYEPVFAAGYDQGAFDYVYSHFRADFGVAPYIILNNNWSGATTDGTTRWGAAAYGPQINSVVQIGPGYDQSALVNSGERGPFTVSRRNGDFYREGWNAALNSGRNIVIVETWNELHEGSDIAESREFGRQYIDLTRQYAGLWRSGKSAVPTSKDAFVRHLYECVLERTGEADGMTSWKQKPTSTTFEQLYAGFFNSPEYGAKATSNTAYVDHLYRCVLFRAADAGGKANWVAQLASGMTRSDLLHSFTASPEFQTGVGATLRSATGFSL